MNPLICVLLLGAPDTTIAPDAAALGRLTSLVAAVYDSSARAFVAKDGALRLGALELSLRLAERDGPGAAAWRARGLATLHWAEAIYDSVGGGYLHSLRDRDPSQPFFEKRTDENAAMIERQLEAHTLSGDAYHLRIAKDVYDYSERVLADPMGGFLVGQVGSRLVHPQPTACAAMAYFRYHRASGDPRPRDFALRSLERMWVSSWDSTYGFVRMAEVAPPSGGRLADLAAAGRAFLHAHALTRQAVDLARARRVGRFVLEHCRDAEDGGFYSVAETPKRKGMQSLRRTRDPESNADAVRFLMALSRATGDESFAEAARGTLEVWLPRSLKKGEAADYWALALDEYLAPPPPPPAAKAAPVERPYVRPRSKRYR